MEPGIDLFAVDAAGEVGDVVETVARMLVRRPPEPGSGGGAALEARVEMEDAQE